MEAEAMKLMGERKNMFRQTGKQLCLSLSIAALVFLSACSNNAGNNFITNDGVAQAPLDLNKAKEKSTDSQVTSLNNNPLGADSVKQSINQTDIKKAIHRYRLRAKIDTGTQQIIGADLNGDAIAEGLVLFKGDEWCISTGCTLVIFSKGPNGFREMTQIKRVKGPVHVAQKFTNGWRDLIVRTGNAGIGEYFVPLKFKGNYPQNATTISEKLAFVPDRSELLFQTETKQALQTQ